MRHRKDKRNRQEDAGFSLAEALVTVVILVTLAAISAPIYVGQTNKAHRTTAIADGDAWNSEIGSLTSGFTRFGTAGTRTITLGAITAGKATLTVNTGTGYAPTSETANPNIVVNVSNGTTLTSGSVTTNSNGWCFIATKEGQLAAYNQSGFQTNSTTCTAGVLS